MRANPTFFNQISLESEQPPIFFQILPMVCSRHKPAPRKRKGLRHKLGAVEIEFSLNNRADLAIHSTDIGSRLYILLCSRNNINVSYERLEQNANSHIT
jgi:hypothetical protein